MNSLQIIEKAGDVLNQIVLQGAIEEMIDNCKITQTIVSEKKEVEKYRLITIESKKGKMIISRRIDDCSSYILSVLSKDNNILFKVTLNDEPEFNTEAGQVKTKYKRIVKSFMSEYYKIVNAKNLQKSNEILDNIIDEI